MGTRARATIALFDGPAGHECPRAKGANITACTIEAAQARLMARLYALLRLVITVVLTRPLLTYQSTTKDDVSGGT